MIVFEDGRPSGNADEKAHSSSSTVPAGISEEAAVELLMAVKLDFDGVSGSIIRLISNKVDDEFESGETREL